MTKYLDETGLKHYTEKLKSSYFDYVDAMRSSASKDVVQPVITNETWTIKDASGTIKTQATKPTDLETGHTIKWSGSWKWTTSADRQNPKTAAGTWGNTIPASGTASSLYSTPDFKVPAGAQIATVTVTAPKSGGIELKNNNIVPITGGSHTHTVTVTEPVINTAYKYYGYVTKKTGLTEAEIKALTKQRSTATALTVNNFNNTDKYWAYAYLKNSTGSNKISSFEVSGDGKYDLNNIFGTQAPQEIIIKNSAGTSQTYFLYVMQDTSKFTAGQTITIS